MSGCVIGKAEKTSNIILLTTAQEKKKEQKKKLKVTKNTAKSIKSKHRVKNSANFNLNSTFNRLNNYLTLASFAN